MAELILGSSPSSAAKPPAGRTLINILIYLGAAVGLVIAAMLIMFFRMTKSFGLRAFRVPSDSMCPTICLNERLIVGMDAFNARAPERGDVILFTHRPKRQRFLKRVVAVGGDKIAPGPGNIILVNGKAVAWPDVCGEPVRNTTPSAEPITFLALTVPQDSLFVVGDNLNLSWDSRYPSYGFVQRDQVQGNALYLLVVRNIALRLFNSIGESRQFCKWVAAAGLPFYRRWNRSLSAASNAAGS